MYVLNKRSSAEQMNSNRQKWELGAPVDYGTKISSFFPQIWNYIVAKANVIDFLRGGVNTMEIDLKGLVSARDSICKACIFYIDYAATRSIRAHGIRDEYERFKNDSVAWRKQ